MWIDCKKFWSTNCSLFILSQQMPEPSWHGARQAQRPWGTGDPALASPGGLLRRCGCTSQTQLCPIGLWPLGLPRKAGCPPRPGPHPHHPHCQRLRKPHRGPSALGLCPLGTTARWGYLLQSHRMGWVRRVPFSLLSEDSQRRTNKTLIGCH